MKFKVTLLSLLFAIVSSQAQEQKFLVLAKFSDKELAKQMETEMVNQLKAEGYQAIITQGNIAAKDLENEEQFLQKITDLGITGLIAFINPETNNTYKKTPSINANVGTKPVKLGIFRVNLGGSVPIAGGTKTKKEIQLSAEFYNKKDAGPVFTKVLKATDSPDKRGIMKKFSESMIKALKKNKIIS